MLGCLKEVFSAVHTLIYKARKRGFKKCQKSAHGQLNIKK